MDPITFSPLYMPRVWGGRELERLYHRILPTPAQPYGEAWEIVDRKDEQSVVDAGIYQSRTLHELWTHHRAAIFGADLPPHPRFPILIKILDARDDLSLQVHPPVHLAATLGGEPKTEMWFIADRDPGAKLYAGLKNGVTREDFVEALAAGTVASCVHEITPQPGDSIFIPSGRLHAIGAGFVIYEIQQNSDTTYRVFDWNRLGLDGKPRELHVAESLASIDFQDFEPAMDLPDGDLLASCDYFITHRKTLAPGDPIANPRADRFSILAIVSGELVSAAGECFGVGRFILLPCHGSPLVAVTDVTLLQIILPG